MKIIPIYRGPGEVARSDHEALRLTQPGGPLRHWVVPTWLQQVGLSFHGKSERWFANNRLEVVARGQEFVADIGDDMTARNWADQMIGAIRA